MDNLNINVLLTIKNVSEKDFYIWLRAVTSLLYRPCKLDRFSLKAKNNFQYVWRTRNSFIGWIETLTTKDKLTYIKIYQSTRPYVMVDDYIIPDLIGDLTRAIRRKIEWEPDTPPEIILLTEYYIPLEDEFGAIIPLRPLEESNWYVPTEVRKHIWFSLPPIPPLKIGKVSLKRKRNQKRDRGRPKRFDDNAIFEHWQEAKRENSNKPNSAIAREIGISLSKLKIVLRERGQ